MKYIVVLAILFIACQEEKVAPGTPMNYDEVLRHIDGSNTVRYEVYTPDSFIIYLPDGDRGIISRITARQLCVVFAGSYCDYKLLIW